MDKVINSELVGVDQGSILSENCMNNESFS